MGVSDMALSGTRLKCERCGAEHYDTAHVCASDVAKYLPHQRTTQMSELTRARIEEIRTSAPRMTEGEIVALCDLALKALEMRPRPISEDQIKHMANRFLGWKLPKDFSPDNGVYFERWYPYIESWKRSDLNCRQPVGTNLLTATQAEAMVRYLVEEAPSPPSQR